MAKSTPLRGSFSATLWRSPRPSTEIPIPNSVTTIATMLIIVISCPNVIHAMNAAARGASVMKSCP